MISTKEKFFSIALVLAMVGGLTACGGGSSGVDDEEPMDSKIVEMSAEIEEPEETELSEDAELVTGVESGEWANDTERITIDGDTVTIERLNDERLNEDNDNNDDNDNDYEMFWVGSYNESDNEVWISERDSEAEMTCDNDTIEFAWSGEDDDVFENLTYTYTNADGEPVSVTTERVSSTAVYEEVVTDENGNETVEQVAVVTSKDDSGETVSEVKKDNSSNTTETAVPSVSTSNETVSADNNNNSNSDSSNNTSSSGNNNSSSSESKKSDTTVSTSPSASNSGNSNSSSSNSGNTATACSHTWNGGAVTKAATCTANGTKTYTCTKCGETKTESISATGHSYSGKVTQNATCSTNGVTTYTCSKCGASYTESIPATGNHNWQAVYKTVHHDATGHYETTPVYEVRHCCGVCGWYIADTSGMSERDEINYLVYDHQYGVHGYTTNYYEAEVQVGTTSTWVVDSVAYDEQVLDHYYCTICNTTK